MENWARASDPNAYRGVFIKSFLIVKNSWIRLAWAKRPRRDNSPATEIGENTVKIRTSLLACAGLAVLPLVTPANAASGEILIAGALSLTGV